MTDEESGDTLTENIKPLFQQMAVIALYSVLPTIDSIQPEC